MTNMRGKAAEPEAEAPPTKREWRITQQATHVRSSHQAEEPKVDYWQATVEDDRGKQQVIQSPQYETVRARLAKLGAI